MEVEEPSILFLKPTMVGEHVSLTYSVGILHEPVESFLEQFDHELIDIPMGDDWGLRFVVTRTKADGGPLIIGDKFVFNQTIILLHQEGWTTPFHCSTCAEKWMEKVFELQQEWARTYHHGYWQAYGQSGPKNKKSYH